jgi:hypothetical protein
MTNLSAPQLEQVNREVSQAVTKLEMRLTKMDKEKGEGDKRVKALEDKVTVLEEKVKTLEGKLETEVLGGIKSLEDKVDSAATNTSGNWASIASNKGAIVAINNMVSKEQAQLKRKDNNVIIFGMEKAESQEELKEAVTKVFAAMEKEDLVEGCTLLKLKGDKGPTIVSFRDKSTQIGVLRASGKLRESAEFKDVYVNQDLTESQMAKESELRKERKVKNDGLTMGSGHLKYGMHKFEGEENEVEFYWGIRNSRVERIKKNK